jgi:NAD(P)-dependent dehydrogenase (short-subunit alcohol dehydrogenase family)
VDQKLLENKVVIITGGAGLIGKTFVRCVAEQGGVSVAADVCQETNNQFRKELSNSPIYENVVFIEADITSKESIKAMILEIHRQFGKIDALVNNAYPRNLSYGRKFEEVTYEDFCQNVSMHLGGYFLTSQQLARYFKKQGYGSIVNMASIYGVIAPRFSIYEHSAMTMPVEYAAIKSAVIHLTRYLAQYLKGSNIRVNCISPGGILNQQPNEFLSRYNSFAATKGMLIPKDLQGALLFLLSDMSAYVNGQNLVVDDGWSL